jgi:hypothetical protein
MDDLRSLAQATCEGKSARDLHSIDRYALRISNGSYGYSIVVFKFRDDQNVLWYRWEYR